MFKKLKDKLKGWTKKVSEESEEIIEESPEEQIEETEEVETEDMPSEEGKEEPKKKSKEERKAEKEKKREEKKQKKLEKKAKKEAEKTEAPEEDKEIPEVEVKKDIEEIVEENKEESAIPELEKEEPVEEVIEEMVQEVKEEPKKKGFLKKIVSKKTQISEENFEEYGEELEMLLLENNVALEVAEKIVQDLKDELTGKEISKKELEKEIENTFKESVKKILIEPFDILEKIKEKKPYVILFCGINGTGKTTSIAKLGKYFQENGLKCVFAAGDTFRAASIEQIKKHGENLDIPVIANDYGSDPASVGFDAVKYAEKNNIDVVLIDTAGRMHTASNLMAQIEKVAKVCKPDTKIFVGESITGNDILEQVKAFNEAVGLDGIILSKADIDEKGGTALSVGYTTEKPILFLGTGQEYKDIEPFDKDKFIDKLGLSE